MGRLCSPHTVASCTLHYFFNCFIQLVLCLFPHFFIQFQSSIWTSHPVVCCPFEKKIFLILLSSFHFISSHHQSTIQFNTHKIEWWEISHFSRCCIKFIHWLRSGGLWLVSLLCSLCFLSYLPMLIDNYRLLCRSTKQKSRIMENEKKKISRASEPSRAWELGVSEISDFTVLITIPPSQAFSLDIHCCLLACVVSSSQKNFTTTQKSMWNIPKGSIEMIIVERRHH